MNTLFIRNRAPLQCLAALAVGAATLTAQPANATTDSMASKLQSLKARVTDAVNLGWREATITDIRNGAVIRVRTPDGNHQTLQVKLLAEPTFRCAPAQSRQADLACKERLAAVTTQFEAAVADMRRQLVGQRVEVKTDPYFRHGLAVARVRINGQDMAATMVEQGLAMYCPNQYHQSVAKQNVEVLTAAHRVATQDRKGLWGLTSGFMMPACDPDAPHPSGSYKQATY